MSATFQAFVVSSVTTLREDTNVLASRGTRWILTAGSAALMVCVRNKFFVSGHYKKGFKRNFLTLGSTKSFLL